MNFKDIHIGSLISRQVVKSEIEISRICRFMKRTEEEIEKMYESESLDTEILLKWCKLLEYDFFRIYSQHLILYAPKGSTQRHLTSNNEYQLPQFRKNIYTQEIIDFILEQIFSEEMTKYQVIEQYGIPKTTLYKWINKYKK